MTKKALIYDPYLDTLGGGERYALTFGLELIKQGYEVEVAWSEGKILDDSQRRFGLDFSKITLNPFAYKIFSERSSIFRRLALSKKYDLIFWVSDGSIPILLSKNNLVHFQVPFTNPKLGSFINKIRTLFVSKFVYNSKFTQSILEKRLNKNKGFVLYPPIDTSKFKPQKKENIILSVARFSSQLTSKRQDVLVEAFQKFSKTNPGYKLVLAGGLVGDSQVIKDLTVQSAGLNVEFVVNPEFSELVNLYSKSKFFWHAAGFQIDQDLEPEKVEHFGMTTVEAIASGCIPLVVAKGGQIEILVDFPELLCNSSSEISDKTISIISDQDLQKSVVDRLLTVPKVYSQKEFNDKILKLFK